MLDTILKVAGLLLSVCMAFVAGKGKTWLLLISAVALAGVLGSFAYAERTHQQEIATTQKAILEKLSGKLWNFERIYSELQFPSYMVLQEALFDAVASGQVKSKPAECSAFNDETILPLKVYYVGVEK